MYQFVLLLLNEQLSKASLDGTVGVCALADVFDGVDVILQGLTVRGHFTQLSHDDDLVTVVQRSGVPRQDAVTSVAPGHIEVLGTVNTLTQHHYATWHRLRYL